MLLFAPLAEEKALSQGEFHRMEQMLAALEPKAEQLDGDVTERELLRLGLEPDTAQRVLVRLEQEPALKRQLRALGDRGIVPVTRISAEYPEKIRQTLGGRGSMLLYCAGNLALFQKECISLVGSRKLRPKGAAFARALGVATAREGLVYVSGGAAGADTAGFLGAMEQGGSAILFVADSLLVRMRQMKRELDSGRLLLVSEYGFDLGFSAGRAYSRNRLIHAMGEKTFVAQADYGSGGTWNGTAENLKSGWSPVFMCNEEPMDRGTRGLIERGCTPVTSAELTNILTLETAQTRIF